MLLQEILKDSNYRLDLFSKDSISNLESKIITKTSKSGTNYYTTCLIREKEIKLTSEEIVRQLYLDKLINEYQYNKEDIEVEISLQRGRDKHKHKNKDENKDDGKERVDILIYREESPYIVIEVKKPKEKEGKKQLESYLRYLNAPLGVLCNGNSLEEFYNNKEDAKYKTSKLERLSGLPKAYETLKEFLDKKYTLKDLYINDELQSKNLKTIIKDFEDVILANSGVDSFEEIFKLIFTKLYDESESVEDNDEIFYFCKNKDFNNYASMIEHLKSLDDKNFRTLQFRNQGDDKNFKERIYRLFNPYALHFICLE